LVFHFREEHRLRVFENRAPKKIFKPKKEEEGQDAGETGY